MVDVPYYTRTAEHCIRTYLLSGALADSLRFYTHEERLDYLYACVEKMSAQKIYNLSEKSEKFVVTKEGKLLFDLFYELYQSLTFDEFSKEDLIEIRDQYFVHGEENFNFYPVLFSAALAFSLRGQTIGGLEKMAPIKENYIDVVTRIFKVDEKGLFRSVFLLLVNLFEWGHVSKNFVDFLIENSAGCSDDFEKVLTYFSDNCHSKSFVLLPSSFIKDFELSYNEYIFLMSLMYLLKSVSYNRNSERPKKYLQEIVQIEQVYLVDLFSVYATLCVFSEHNYSLIYKAIGEDLPEIREMKGKLESIKL